MWIYSKTRGEHDRRFLLNLDHFANISLSQIGEKWYVDVMTRDDSTSIATLETQEQAETVIRRIFDSIAKGEQALDLDTQADKPASEPEPQQKPPEANPQRAEEKK